MSSEFEDVLIRSCAVPVPLVTQLLTLLTEAAEENCQARRVGALVDSTAQVAARPCFFAKSEDLQWILALFTGSLMDASEARDSEGL